MIYARNTINKSQMDIFEQQQHKNQNDNMKAQTKYQ